MIYVTSDIHFGHKNILRFNPATRPYDSVEEMNQALIENWNSVVRPEDVVYNLGDFAFLHTRDQISILERLNGQHHLIRGNHDGNWRKKSNVERALSNQWFNSIQDYLEIKHRGIKIVLCHYAMRVWNQSHRGSIMLYGHSHGSLPGSGRSMDVGIDACDLPSRQRPFLLDDVIDFLLNKKVEVVDHHQRSL